MEHHFKNLIEVLEYWANKQPDKSLYIFLEDGINKQDEITYKEFESKAKSVAAHLQENNNPGDRIILLFPNSIEFIISLYGCILAGMIGIPSYPPRKNQTNDRFFSILDDSGASLILSTSQIQFKINKQFSDNKVLSDIPVLIYEEVNFSNQHRWKKPDINAEDTVILQYTSGSTGSPKGVMVSHANILHNEQFIQKAFGHDENLVVVGWLPNFHDMGLFGTLLQPIYTGGMRVIISPAAFIRNPINWLRAIDNFNGITAGAPNFAFDYCIQKIPAEQRKDIDLSSLRVMFCGAEPIRRSTLIKFAHAFEISKFQLKQFYPCYGLAESTLMVTGGNFKEEPVFFNASIKALESNKVEKSNTQEDSFEFVSCGQPSSDTRIEIVDPDTLVPSPSNEIGEIWVSSPSVAKGYWNNIEDTKKTFSAILRDSRDGPFLRTGDLGFIRDGELYVSGRLKDLIIIRGTNHYPQDIELTVEVCHPALRKNAGACFSVDLAGEERLVVVNEVDRAFMRELNAEEVFDAIRMKLAEEHNVLPFSIFLIRAGSIPKTSSGKIQRQACKQAYLKKELSILDEWKMQISDQAPVKAIAFNKESLREWLINWLSAQKDLDPSTIDPDKPITAYGLDSLLAVNLEKKVNETFNISFPIESFLQQNTINQLVEEGERLLKGKS